MTHQTCPVWYILLALLKMHPQHLMWTLSLHLWWLSMLVETEGSSTLHGLGRRIGAPMSMGRMMKMVQVTVEWYPRSHSYLTVQYRYPPHNITYNVSTPSMRISMYLTQQRGSRARTSACPPHWLDCMHRTRQATRFQKDEGLWPSDQVLPEDAVSLENKDTIKTLTCPLADSAPNHSTPLLQNNWEGHNVLTKLNSPKSSTCSKHWPSALSWQLYQYDLEHLDEWAKQLSRLWCNWANPMSWPCAHHLMQSRGIVTCLGTGHLHISAIAQGVACMFRYHRSLVHRVWQWCPANGSECRCVSKSQSACSHLCQYHLHCGTLWATPLQQAMTVLANGTFVIEYQRTSRLSCRSYHRAQAGRAAGSPMPL